MENINRYELKSRDNLFLDFRRQVGLSVLKDMTLFCSLFETITFYTRWWDLLNKYPHTFHDAPTKWRQTSLDSTEKLKSYGVSKLRGRMCTVKLPNEMLAQGKFSGKKTLLCNFLACALNYWIISQLYTLQKLGFTFLEKKEVG